MKKISLIMVMILLLLTMTGCSEGANGYQLYTDALAKNDQVFAGSETVSVSVTNQMDYEKLNQIDPEVTKYMRFFEKINVEVATQFNKNTSESAVDIYLGSGGLGLDLEYYDTSKAQFMYVPLMGKYVDFNKVMLEAQESGLLTEDMKMDEMIVDEAMLTELGQEISQSFTEILTSEDVVKGEKAYVETEEGKVKTTHITIEATDEQIKVIAKKILDRFMNKEMIQKFGKAMSAQPFNQFANQSHLNADTKDSTIEMDNFDSITDEQVASYRKIMDELLNNITIKQLKGEVYIDFDGYLVEELYTIELGYTGNVNPGINGTTITIASKLWDINKAPQFEFPVVSENQWFELKDIESLQSIKLNN